LRKTSTGLPSPFIFPSLAVLFCFSMFYRAMNAVIAPDLVKDFQLDPERLGLLGSAFFYTFAVLQIPMGLLLDRVGPRKVLSLFLLVGAAGTFIFASATTFHAAFAGMSLIGAGMAPVLVGSLKVFVSRYPRGRFPTLSGSIISIGALGSVLATSPLVCMISLIGWRLTLMYSGLFTVVLSAIMFYLLEEGTPEQRKGVAQDSRQRQQIGIVKSMQMVVSQLSFWQIGLLAFFRYGTFVALQGVWLGPYLMVAKHFQPIAAGNILVMLSVGSIAGALTAGYLVEKVFRNTKTVLLLGVGCYALLLLSLAGIWNIESAAAHASLFVLPRFLLTTFGILVYLHGKELFPAQMSGTVMAGVNFFLMAGGGFFIQIIGLIISLFVGASPGDSLGAYHLAFFVCFAGMAGSLIFYAFSRNAQES